MIVDRTQLVESARDFAGRSLRAYLKADNRVILMDAACSLEHLSKAYLASLHPALLMDIRNGQLDSLLHLVGCGDKAGAPFPRTISSREALNRVLRLLPGLDLPTLPLNQLIDVRDGIVHVGYLTDDNTREALTAFLRYCNALYDELSIPAGERWNSHAELVRSLISQSLTEVEHEVQRKIGAAKNLVGELMAQIPKEEHGSVGFARQQRASLRRLPGERRVEVDCPACRDSDATCVGTTETEFGTYLEPGEDGEDIVQRCAYRIFHARRLSCGVCELHLKNPDELKAAGLPISWTLDEEVPPSEYADNDLDNS